MQICQTLFVFEAKKKELIRKSILISPIVLGLICMSHHTCNHNIDHCDGVRLELVIRSSDMLLSEIWVQPNMLSLAAAGQ